MEIDTKRTIALSGSVVAYSLRVSTRAKYVRLTMHPGGSLVVTVPSRAPLFLVESFVIRKADWILRTMKRMSTYRVPLGARGARREYLKYKDEALMLAHTRLTHFNSVYGFTIGRVTIRNQKTCWGSCSKKGNLNFSYKIALLPAHLRDYIIVHELCHLQEFNHSPAFWALLARCVPDHKRLRGELQGKSV